MTLTALVVKDIKQLLRDPKTLLMVLLMPVMVMAMFVTGYGRGGGSIPIAIVDLDGSSVSWQLVDSFRNSRDFDVAYLVSTVQEGVALVREGRV